MPMIVRKSKKTYFILFQFGPICIGGLNSCGCVFEPEGLHFQVVVQVEGVLYDSERLWVRGREVIFADSIGAVAAVGRSIFARFGFEAVQVFLAAEEPVGAIPGELQGVCARHGFVFRVVGHGVIAPDGFPVLGKDRLRVG